MLLNLHVSERPYFEHLRVVEAILSGAVVVSEPGPRDRPARTAGIDFAVRQAGVARPCWRRSWRTNDERRRLRCRQAGLGQARRRTRSARRPSGFATAAAELARAERAEPPPRAVAARRRAICRAPPARRPAGGSRTWPSRRTARARSSCASRASRRRRRPGAARDRAGRRGPRRAVEVVDRTPVARGPRARSVLGDRGPVQPRGATSPEALDSVAAQHPPRGGGRRGRRRLWRTGRRLRGASWMAAASVGARPARPPPLEPGATARAQHGARLRPRPAHVRARRGQRAVPARPDPARGGAGVRAGRQLRLRNPPVLRQLGAGRPRELRALGVPSACAP